MRLVEPAASTPLPPGRPAGHVIARTSPGAPAGMPADGNGALNESLVKFESVQSLTSGWAMVKQKFLLRN